MQQYVKATSERGFSTPMHSDLIFAVQGNYTSCIITSPVDEIVGQAKNFRDAKVSSNISFDCRNVRKRYGAECVGVAMDDPYGSARHCVAMAYGEP